MNRLAILLVHGFSGRDRDLLPLAEQLRATWERESVHLMQLPGHAGEGANPGFDRAVLMAELTVALERLRKSTERLVVIGHSTGGNLLLAALDQAGIIPDLLVLAATPFRIDSAYLARWQQHCRGQEPLSLTALSGLIQLINEVARKCAIPCCPALLLQGEDDPLVIPREAQLWQQSLAGEVRLIKLPAGEHQLFSGPCRNDASKAIIDEIKALLTRSETNCQDFTRRLIDAEPEAAQYVEANRTQVRHLSMSPSGQRLQGLVPEFPEVVPWAPAFANIEITTFCNFSCRHCARTVLQPAEQMMPLELFERLLQRVPSAYRVTLVGLGEPLLHPQLTEMISLAKAQGRRVGLVTNAQLLTASHSAGILDAGLDSVAFSLDAASPELLAELRPGSDLSTIEANISTFCALARRRSRPVSRAVFAAVSAASLPGLEALIERVSQLGVQVLMLSDLNFTYNQQASLSTHLDEGREDLVKRAVAHGFSLGLPVLGVRALEDLGLAQHYRDALLLPVQQLYRRSKERHHCCSPWQTLSINVAGELAVCDCQPETKVGSLTQQSLTSLWNGPVMREQRRRMLGGQPAPQCLICPRY